MASGASGCSVQGPDNLELTGIWGLNQDPRGSELCAKCPVTLGHLPETCGPRSRRPSSRKGPTRLSLSSGAPAHHSLRRVRDGRQASLDPRCPQGVGLSYQGLLGDVLLGLTVETESSFIVRR
ncbi:hypothetical protein IAU60_005371 [Kwoniella sp. DSM 27419]